MGKDIPYDCIRKGATQQRKDRYIMEYTSKKKTGIVIAILASVAVISAILLITYVSAQGEKVEEDDFVITDATTAANNAVTTPKSTTVRPNRTTATTTTEAAVTTAPQIENAPEDSTAAETTVKATEQTFLPEATYDNEAKKTTPAEYVEEKTSEITSQTVPPQNNDSPVPNASSFDDEGNLWLYDTTFGWIKREGENSFEILHADEDEWEKSGHIGDF